MPTPKTTSRPAPREISVSWEDYHKAEKKTVLQAYAMFDFTNDKPFRTSQTFTVAGQVMLIKGAVHSDIESSYRIAYILEPARDYQGPIYTEPAHIGMAHYENVRTMPDGSKRYRGNDEGVLVQINDERMVLSEEVHLRPRLPDSIFDVSLAEAKAFHAKESKTGWRALWCRAAEPTWKTYNGAVLARYPKPSGEDYYVVHAKDSKGRIFDIHVQSDDLVDQALAAQSKAPKVMAAAEQFSLF